jgi:magnesium transporter
MTQLVDPSLEDTVDGRGGVRAEFLDFSDRSRGRLRLEEVRPQIAQGRFVWIDIDCDVADVGAIRSMLPDDVGRGIDLSGILAMHSRAGSEHISALHRAERLLHIVLVGTTHAEPTSGGERLDIVIGEGFLLTLHRGPHAVLSAVRRNYVYDFEQHAATPSFLLYEICNEQVEQFLATEGRLEEEVEATRVALQRAAGEAAIERLAEVSGRLLVLRKQVAPVRRILEELVSRKTTLVSESTLGFLGLMIGTLERLLTDIASNREILENSLQLSLTVMSHRTNQTMNRLAVVSTIFLPLTFLCGVYGMNFEVMPEIRWAHGYIYFWALSSVVTLTLVVLLRRSRLL